MIKNPIDAVRFAIEFLNSKKTIKKSKATAFTDHESSYSSSLERLIAQASLYNDLSSFLDDLALGNPQDGYEANSECISLMTIHAAKGLEFDYVFVPCLEDGLLPFTLFEQPKMGCESDTEAQEQIEEERRLLYVAMTRARIGLYLSWARSRHLFGRKLSLPPSRFLADIENLVPLIERRMPPKPKDIQLTLF
jgi:superfamily I DNA/RNA helicase